MKTFIRRLGNKSKHLKHILPLIPKDYNTYYEPFLGTGAVFLNLQPDKYILNDLNKDIIDMWKLIINNPESLITYIDSFKYEMTKRNQAEKKAYCKELLEVMKVSEGELRTILYFILSYSSFNGSIERSGKYVFDGLYKALYVGKDVHFWSDNFKKKIRNLSIKSENIYNKDYIEILKKTKEGDFVFIDPPYIKDTSYCFNYIQNQQFDIKQLHKELQNLDKKGVKWMMTNLGSSQVREIFKYYRIVEYRNVTSFMGRVKKEKNIIELIIMNY